VAYAYNFDDPARNQKRTLAFVLVVLIHAGFFYVLNSGLGAKLVQVITGPVQTEIIDEPKDEENEPPPPPPEIEAPPPYVPPPDFAIEMPAAQTNTTAITNTTSVRPTAPPPTKAPEKASVKTPPSTTGKGARITQPEYPPSSRPRRRRGHGYAAGLRTRDGQGRRGQGREEQRLPEA
jgi:protein TonB